MFVVFQMSYRCDARCPHCIVSASPERDAELTVVEVRRWIADLGGMSRDAPLRIGFSGGEPFLRFDSLATLVACAHAAGASVACVTNGGWAGSADVAHQRLAALQRAGLGRLTVSHDRFHAPFVPLANVRRVVRACLDLALPVGLKCVVLRDGPGLADLLGDLRDVTLDRELSVQEIRCLPAGRGRSIPASRLVTQPHLPTGGCAGLGVFHVTPTADVYPCCTPDWPRALYLGNARKLPLSQLIRRAERNRMLRLLSREGPAYFVPFLQASGDRIADEEFVNQCHLCQRVLSALGGDPRRRAAFRCALGCDRRERQAEATGLRLARRFLNSGRKDRDSTESPGLTQPTEVCCVDRESHRVHQVPRQGSEAAGAISELHPG